MENPAALDGGADVQNDGRVLSSTSFKGSENLANDSAFDEKFLLEDLDSYWDDLSARLTVSRMVSDSVIKGIVNAVEEEAAEKISLKEAEMAILNKRLLLCLSDEVKANKSGQSVTHRQLKGMTFEVQSNCSHSSTEYPTSLSNLRTSADEQLQKLKTGIKAIRKSNSCGMTELGSGKMGLCSVLDLGKVPDRLNQMDETVDALKLILADVYEEIGSIIFSLNNLHYEQQWKWEFEKEVDAVIIQNFIRELREGYETKLCEQKSLFNNQNKSCLQKADELSRLREELDCISKTLFSSELGHLFSYGSQETFEEWNTAKRKDYFPHISLTNHLLSDATHSGDNGVISTEKSEPTILEVADFPLLLHMSKEELINYYKTEMNKMKRQQESALHEKTEELFMLKREFLKEKGSSHFRKDKEFEILRKRIPDVILKLDNILIESEKFPMLQDDHDKTCSFKDRVGSLVSENQHLRNTLSDKRKEIKCLASQVSDAACQMSNYSSAEIGLLRQTKKLKQEIEDMKIEAFIRDEVNDCILRNPIVEVEWHMEDLEIQTEMAQEFCGILLNGYVGDVNLAINSVIMKYDNEKKRLKANLLEKEKALKLETEKTDKLRKNLTSVSKLVEEKEKALVFKGETTEKLKKENVSLSMLIEQKNKFVSEAGSTMKQQKERFESLSQELCVLRNQVSEQERLILENKNESNLVNGRLDEALEQVCKYQVELNELNQKFRIVSDDLKDAEKQKAMLHDIIREKQSNMSLAVSRESGQKKQMEAIIIFIQELSKVVAGFERRITENIRRENSRLELLHHECNALIKRVGFLQRKELWYKQRLEIRSSDLKKAEIEVDLLGDEVDALLTLIEKMYIALDHYSPVLQHYPGVMEILKLVRNELKGNR